MIRASRNAAVMIALLTACASAVVAGEAHAGALLGDNALDAASAGRYRARIAAARRAAPRAFTALAALRAALPRLARMRRGRFVLLGRPLSALARRSAHHRWALVEALAFGPDTRGGLSAKAWQGWRAGLLDALGRLRDPTLAPLLLAAVRRDVADRMVARAAVEALARLARPRDVPVLLRAVTRRSADAATLLDALGEHRRLVMVKALQRMRRDRRWDRPARLAILRALGRAGNAWAWRTAVIRRSGEGRVVRDTAARELVAAFVAASDAIERERAATSLLIVAAPSTTALVAGAKQQHPELARELEILARRFARSPVR